jgi:WD40 repeat protein
MHILVVLLVFPFAAPLWAAEPLPEGAILRFGATSMRGCSGPFAFTPDGKNIAVVTGDKSDRVTIHECRTGKSICSLDVGSRVSSLSFSPDGRRLLTSGNSGLETLLWDMQTGKELRKIAGHTAAFIDQGRKIVTQLPQLNGAGNRSMGIYDGAKYDLLDTIESSDQLIFSHLLSPTHSARKREEKWEIATHPEGKVVCTIPFGENLRFGRFHDDGKLFLFKDKVGIHVWDVKTGEKVRSIAARTDSEVVVSPDGKQLAWSGYDNHEGIAFVWVCDIAQGKPRHVGPPTNNFEVPLYSPNGKTLAFINDSKALILRDVRTGKDVVQSLGHTGRVFGAHFTANGKHIITRDRNSIRVWERDTGKLIRRCPDDLPGEEKHIDGTLASDFVVTVAPDDTLRQRDLVTGKELRVLEGKHGFVFGAAGPAAVSRDAKIIALVSKDYNIRAYDLATGKILLDFDTPCAVWDVFLSRKGDYLSWSSQSHPKGDRIRYLHVSSGKEVDRDELPPSAFPLANESGRWLPFADLLPRLRDLKLVRADDKVTLDGWVESPYRVCLSRDGRYLLASKKERRGDNEDRFREVSLGIWDVATGRRLPALVTDRQSTDVAAFSPDGRLLVSTTQQGSIHVWELATGRERAVLSGHLSDSVGAIAFSPDGRYLISGGNDTQVFLWDLWGRKGSASALSHSRTRQRELFKQLLDPDALKANVAMGELAADPEGTASFLTEQIKPVAKLEPKEVARLIRELGDDDFAHRETASETLTKQGDRVLDSLKDAQKKAVAAEQKRRLQLLIDDLGEAGARGEALRTVRAVETVERMGTRAARSLLESWASGEAEARLTQAAKTALAKEK